MKPLDPRLLRWARATGVFLAASVLGGTVTAVAIIVQAYLLARMITEVFEAEATVAAIGGQVSALAVVVVVRALLAFGLEWMAFRSAAAAKSQLRMAVLEHIVAMGPAAMDRRTPAELAQLTGRGIDALDAYFARYLPQLVLAAIVPVAIIAVVATQDLLAAVIIVLTLPLIPVFMILIGLYTQRQVGRQWRTLGVLAGHFLDVVAGLPTLKVFGRARAQAATLREIGDRYRRATLSVLRVSFVSALALELLATLSVAIVAVSIGLRLVNGDMALFNGLWVLILAPEAYLPLRMVGVHFHAAADGIAAAQKLLDLLDQPVPDRPQVMPTARPQPLVGLPFRMTDVTVTYPGRTLPALDTFGMTARPGRIVALAGESGAGKSTVLRALLGFAPVSPGTVTTGIDAHAWSLAATPDAAWLRQFAWLPQEPIMVAGTVAENVRLGNAAATEAEILAAAELAGLADAGGVAGVLAQPVSEGGAGVSAGQRRRVGLARILVRAAPIVLLDEPSAALDEATEATVVGTIERLRDEGRTVVVVAHRPALLAVADEVVRLAPPAPDAVDPATPLEQADVLPGVGR